MSAGIERRAATTRLGRWWQGWRFHLNAALLIVPLAVLPSAWNEARTVSGQLSPPHSGEAALNAGPFALRLSELAPPAPDQRGFRLVLCAGCEQRIREVRLTAAASAPATPGNGAIFIGPPARMQTAVPRTDAALWLTVLEWNGALHGAKLPERFDWAATP